MSPQQHTLRSIDFQEENLSQVCYGLDEGNFPYYQNRDHEWHEIKDHRHHARGVAQLLGMCLGPGDELVGESKA